MAADRCPTHLTVGSGALLPGVVLESYWNWRSVFSSMPRRRHRPRVMRTVAASEDYSRLATTDVSPTVWRDTLIAHVVTDPQVKHAVTNDDLDPALDTKEKWGKSTIHAERRRED